MRNPHPKPKPNPLPLDGGMPSLTRGLFRRVFYSYGMNIALQFRPINVRLYVAYMADAAHGGYSKCDPGNTFTRFICEHQHDGVYDLLRTDHPYTRMWSRINTFYDVNRLYEMSDDEIIDMFNNARANGIDGTTRKCTGMDIMMAKRRWDEYGWNRYERKRTGRRRAARMCALPIAACFGIVLPQ